MRFRVRLDAALRLVEGMGADNYTPPANVKQLMADFYLLQLLDAGGPRSTVSHHREEIRYELDDVRNTLVPYLRGHLLDKVGYSICCEIRHLFDRLVNWAELNKGEEEWGEISGDPNPHEVVRVATAAMKRAGVPTDTVEKIAMFGIYNRRPDPDEIDITDRFWCARAGVKLFLDSADLEWSGSYGGRPWSLACKTWLQLYATKSLNDQAIYCDKIYSVEHNTGSILNKNPEYDGSWLHSLLDLKYNTNDPEQLIRYASPFMRKLGLMATRDLYGRGWDNDKWGSMVSREATIDQITKTCEAIADKVRQSYPQVKVTKTSPSNRHIVYLGDTINIAKGGLYKFMVIATIEQFRLFTDFSDGYNAAVYKEFDPTSPSLIDDIAGIINQYGPKTKGV